MIEFMLRQWPYIWTDSLGADIKAGIANTYLWPQHNGRNVADNITTATPRCTRRPTAKRSMPRC